MVLKRIACRFAARSRDAAKDHFKFDTEYANHLKGSHFRRLRNPNATALCSMGETISNDADSADLQGPAAPALCPARSLAFQNGAPPGLDLMDYFWGPLIYACLTPESARPRH